MNCLNEQNPLFSKMINLSEAVMIKKNRCWYMLPANPCYNTTPEIHIYSKQARNNHISMWFRNFKIGQLLNLNTNESSYFKNKIKLWLKNNRYSLKNPESCILRNILFLKNHATPRSSQSNFHIHNGFLLKMASLGVLKHLLLWSISNSSVRIETQTHISSPSTVTSDCLFLNGPLQLFVPICLPTFYHHSSHHHPN